MNALYIGLAVTATLSVAAVAMLFPRKNRDVRNLYTEGLDYLLRGNLNKSYKCFKEVITRNTDHIPAYLKMGQVMRQGGAKQKALKLHDSLLARPNLTAYDRVELYKNLALDYSALGQHRRAVEWAQAILKIDKRNTWALRHLVKFYRDIGDWAAGGKYLAAWQKIANQVDTRLQALCRFREGYDQRHQSSPATVRAFYKQALKIDPNFTPAYYYLAESYADEAEVHLQRAAAAEAEESSLPTTAQRPLTNEEEELLTHAVAHWSSFIERSPQDTFRVLPRLEETLFSLQRFDDIEPLMRQVLEKDPENLDTIASLANFYVRKGELDKAEQLLNTIPEDATSQPLIQAIRIKLKYRRNADKNLMPALDHLVDSIRINAQAQICRRDGQSSLMSWLEPSCDPLEHLA